MEIITYFKANIDYIVVGIVFLSGFFQERILPYQHVKVSKDKKYDTTIKTFFISLIASSIYIILANKGSDMPIAWAKYFLSYFTATSLYELLIRPVTKWIKAVSEKYFGKDEDPTT